MVCRAMLHWDPELLAARVERLEEAVRTLRRSNAELLAQMDTLLSPAGQFSGKSIDYLQLFYNNKNTECM